MLESLELNNRDPRGRELYVRHQQVYSLLELNVRLAQLRNNGIDTAEIDRAAEDLSALISDTVTRYEEATAPLREAPVYTDTQISKLEKALNALHQLCECQAPISRLMQAARNVVTAGSLPRFDPPRLIVSNV
ncbi:hypothetical protein [Nisaea sp.]|uniref:hypothetical protein n=1 Tax=Nisaea sp. TaxID=2024842 RepID=UPI003B51B855